ncbi:hypothetical protein GCM10010289_79830 [Streptomyces violascens]|nr:hypothetical protein GCM10010289_79830 [Streptomyces violascens]
MSVVITGGQRGDTPQFEPVLENIRVPRIGPTPSQAPGQSPRGQSLRLTEEPRLPAQTQDPLHDPGEA